MSEARQIEYKVIETTRKALVALHLEQCAKEGFSLQAAITHKENGVPCITAIFVRPAQIPAQYSGTV